MSLSDGTKIDADMIIVGIGAIPRTELAAAAGLKIDIGIVVDEYLRTSDPDIFVAGDIAHAYNPAPGAAHWPRTLGQRPTSRRRLGQGDAGSRHSRPTTVVLLHTDQYDLSMDTGDSGPAGYDKAIFRRHSDSREMIVFWLHEQRVQGGMNINIWDVAEDIERVIQASRSINANDISHPDIPLASRI